jgi:amino acid transporter
MQIEIKPLQRSMKLIGALLITLSAITPASSIFIIAPGVVQQAGTGALISFIAGAIVSLLTAFVYAELSSAFPVAGGEYAIIGRVLGPLPGFIVLGLNFVTLILIVTIIPLGIGNYIGVLFPGVPPITAGIVTIMCTTLCGILNLRTNAIITGVFLAIEMAALLTLTTLGFTHINRSVTDVLLHPVFLNTNGVLEAASIGIIGMATAVAIFAYNGYGNPIYLGEEIHEAPKDIGRTILWALFITIIAEAIPVMAVLIGAPDLKSLFGSQNPFSDFVAALGGHTLNVAVSLGVALAIINANIAFIVLVGRFLYSTGRDHVWAPPINYAVTRVHKKFHSPWVATLICGALACAGCFIDMHTLLVLTGTGVIAIYAILCIAVIVGRRKGITSHGHYRMPLYPLPPITALIALGYVVYANFLDPEVGRPSLWATLAMMAVSAGYYFFVLRRKGDWILRGPDDK